MKNLLLLLFSTASISFTAQILSFKNTEQKNTLNYNYLGAYTANGTPLYLEDENDYVSIETLEMVSNSLPESYPVPEYNPHYITSGFETDVILDDKADVWVTFVSEGAGYKNVLGFYTYDVNNPRTTAPNRDEITIIFPNVSALGSGGGLQVGNKVKIGTFEAGTGIGWVLLANAWSPSQQKVYDGHWRLFSNPDFNPEKEEELRYHNVLLNDSDNERVILGFEDIRRDYSSCDQDFNDAIFYITANPYEAIRTNNTADITSATDVTSANDGGLESNGDLASKIANRNYNRAKNGTSFNQKRLQKKFSKKEFVNKGTGISLENLLPETGMFGTEKAFISSPEDLLGITNASEIFSVDYYQNEKRIAAVFATETGNSIYDHSKVICDRLNGSELLDVRTVIVKNHQIISSKIKRATGEIEYTLSFSVKLENEENELFSFWNIKQYPTGDYFNFQIWGGSFSQVFSITNSILDALNDSKGLKSTKVDDIVPNVFVKSGSYKNGNIALNIINKTAEKEITVNANISRTETSERTEINESLALSGNWEEEINLTSGILFDLGLSIATANSSQKDALYLADGPWGTDFLDEYATLENFEIIDKEIDYENDIYEIERAVIMEGEVKGNINLFRHLLPGDQTLNVEGFTSLALDIKNNMPVEVVLMPENMTNWEDRLRFTIPANTAITSHNIAFRDFKNASGTNISIDNIKTIVFSVINDYQNFVPFSVEIESMSLNQSSALNIESNEIENISKVINYPNPFRNHTTIKLINASNEIEIIVIDLLGKTVDKQTIKAQGKKVNYKAPKLNSGIYKYLITDDKRQTYSGSFIIK